MHCPRCGEEFPPSVRACPACQVRLQAESPLVPVVHSVTAWQAELIRSQLAEAGIPCLVQGDEWSLFSPFAYAAYTVRMTARILRRHRETIDAVVHAVQADT